MSKKGKRFAAGKLLLVMAMIIALIVGGMIVAQADVSKEQPVLVITGSGLGSTEGAAELGSDVKYEKAYTLSELQAMTAKTQDYTTLNTYCFTGFLRATGVELSTLLADTGFSLPAYNGGISFIEPKADGTDSWIYTINNDNRYYFPNLSTAVWAKNDGSVPPSDPQNTGNPANTAVGNDPIAVSTLIAWADSTADTVAGLGTPTNYTGKTVLKNIMGQATWYDANNSGFNKYLSKIRLGDELDKVIKIGTSEYTRAQILMMERVQGTASYNTKAGTATKAYTGIQLADLLTDYDDNDTVEFHSYDAYDNSAANTTVANIRANAEEYVLAYEIGDNADSKQAVYENKNAVNGNGYLSLFDGSRQLKGITEIQITAGSGIDFSTSEYKHINHEELGNMYNIPAITGATLTIEGPGTSASAMPSIAEIERLSGSAPYFRGEYTDYRNGNATTLTYEGVRLKYLLDNKSNRLDTGTKVTIKNRNRQDIATFTYAEVAAADATDQPIIVAYGTGNGTDARPFIYDSEIYSSWYSSALDNADGCVKLVYDQGSGGNKKFGNMAYIYVSEDSTPGYEHDKAPYNDVSSTQHILTLNGSLLGREVNLTVEQLEGLNDLILTGEYSLANNSYWYVNEYRGIDLYNLLLKAGLPADAATSNANANVIPHAGDNFTGSQHFKLGQISNPDNFFFFEKDPADGIDESFDPSTVDPIDSGYPVLIAYGINEYPYVVNSSSPGYNKGLSNSGGPLRLIHGKQNYSDANGSHQTQLLDYITIGEVVNYSTHYDNAGASGAYQALKDNSLSVEVKINGSSDITNYTIEDLEKMIYGNAVTFSQKKQAQAKNYYMVKGYADLYEGVNLWYLLSNKIGLPGDSGTVTFYDDAAEPNSVEVSLDDLRELGSCSETGKNNLSAVLAFAKNGYPLVLNKDANGYVNYDTANTVLNDSGFTVKNQGGPLQFVLPQITGYTSGATLNNVSKIVVNLEPDSYAHLSEPYNAYADNVLTVEGDGVNNAKSFTVSQLEAMSSYKNTAVYNLRSSNADKEIRYRGLDLYNFLKNEVGLKANASGIVVTYNNGASKTYTMSELSKSNYQNSVSGTSNLKMMLAFGANLNTTTSVSEGLPLVPTDLDEGYEASYENQGGPLAVVTGQTSETENNAVNCAWSVTKIEVTAADQLNWKHDFEPYSQYRDIPVLRITGSEIKTPVTLTLGDLEDMDDIVETGEFTAVTDQNFQGVNVWKLLQKIGLKEGLSVPTSVNVISGDGYPTGNIVDAILNGAGNSSSDKRNVILAYAVEGVPFVEKATDPGYDGSVGNTEGLLRLIYHESQGKCIKNATCIVVGESLPGSGTNGFETPSDYPVADVADVFAIKDQEGNTLKSYSLYELKALGWERSQYSYLSSSVEYTDSVVGVKLDDLLYDAGLDNSDANAKIKLITSDGYAHDTYENISVSDVVSKNYLVTYVVDGNLVYDKEKGSDTYGYVRIYRNHNDGATDWLNCLKNMVVAQVTEGGVTPPIVEDSAFALKLNGTKVKDYTLTELKSFAAQTKTYPVSGEVDTVEGISLSTLLVDAGITATNGTITLNFQDGFENSEKGADYKDMDLADVTAKNMFIAYKVNGQDISDELKNNPSIKAEIRLYANINAGTDSKQWQNCQKNVMGVDVTPSSTTTYSFNMWKTNSQEIPLAGNVRCVVPDANGGVWIGTLMGGAYYHDANGNWSSYHKQSTPALLNNTIVDICPDAEGGVWFAQGSQDNAAGVAYLKDNKITIFNQENTNNGLGSDFVQQVKVDSDGQVWFGHGTGVSVYNPAYNSWIQYNKADGIPANSVNTVILDQKGGAWVGCYPDEVDAANNVYRGGYAYISNLGEVTPYVDEAVAHQTFAGQWVRGISLDANGGVYVVRAGVTFGASLFTEGGYVDYVSPTGNRTIYTGYDLLPGLESITDVEIRYVKVDANNGLWFGTTGNGLYYKAALKSTPVHYNSTVVDGQAAWTQTGFDNIWNIAVLKDGTVFTGGNGGVAYATFDASSGNGNGELFSPGAAARIHTVSFNSMGASSVASQSVKNGAKAIMPVQPINVGYTFAGWYKDPFYAEAFDFNTPITNNTTVYAKWVIKKNLHLYLNSKTYYVNGVAATMDVAPLLYTYNKVGYTMVPLRFVSEALGAQVSWDGKNKTVTISKGGDSFSLKIGQISPAKGLDCPPIIEKGRTLVPIRYVANNLDCSVQYNGKTKPIIITER
ncbi:MAG: stalk domain-containing protein [Bacillota bacterium]